MKALLLVGLLIAPSASALAQTGAPAPATASSGLTLDSSIEALMASPGAKAVVLASLPDLEAAPGYDQFKAVSLRRLQPHSGGKITDEHLAAIEAGLKALPSQ
ncbi:hypothetical protein [Sphingomonas sp.]|jgi:hypothetical protein|uniref:hypothetical protein n=1 Tax=Sphingomonas sp. TaxID=28214 RepID=UPI0035C862DC